MLSQPRTALAWWEATLQQVDISMTLDQSGNARLAYDLRYHVDRGRFEGLTLSNPGRVIEWDRFASYIEDSHGRRYPIRVMRRGRDGAYLVRIVNAPGLRRGWVNVHLEYSDDLMDCCLRLDVEEKPRLSWTALNWDVGMDRMTVTVNLDGTSETPEPDEETGAEFTIDPLEDGGILVERIRPVRWYELRLGLVLPRNWLQRRPQREAAVLLATSENEEEEVPLQVVHAQESSRESFTGLLFALLALLCLTVLCFKTWITAKGFRGTSGATPALLLPKIPPLLRWGFAGSAMLVGAWLQSSSFIAAGTLSFAVGVLLTLRKPIRNHSQEPPSTWTRENIDTLESLAKEDGRGRRRWATFFDGTTLAGFPLTVIAIGGSLALTWWVLQEFGRLFVDAVAIDLALTIAALLLTARRRDALPCGASGTAPQLLKVTRSLETSFEDWSSKPVVLLGGPEADPTEVRLSLSPPPWGLKQVILSGVPRLGLRGWSYPLQAEVELEDGTPSIVRARGPRSLSRRLRRMVDKAGQGQQHKV